MKKLILSFLFLCSCTSSVPLDPATGQPLSENASDVSFTEKQALQNEMLYRQEVEKKRQAEELKRLERQDYYNKVSDRFED